MACNDANGYAADVRITFGLIKKRMNMRKSNFFSDTVDTAQADLEKLVGDLRSVLSSKDLDNVPEIKLLRQRLEDSAGQAKEAALAADRYAHDEPWRVAGAALAVGALIGFIFSRR
jgi:ElaB/YqjD/DUF883 family membrane-anchored ribosome-binding protein